MVFFLSQKFGITLEKNHAYWSPKEDSILGTHEINSWSYLELIKTKGEPEVSKRIEFLATK